MSEMLITNQQIKTQSRNALLNNVSLCNYKLSSELMCEVIMTHDYYVSLSFLGLFWVCFGPHQAEYDDSQDWKTSILLIQSSCWSCNDTEENTDH